MNKKLMMALLLGSTVQFSQAEVLQISYTGELMVDNTISLLPPTNEEMERAFNIELDGNTISGVIYYDTAVTPAPWTFTVFGMSHHYNQIVQQNGGSHIAYRAEDNVTDLVSGAISLPHLHNDDHLILRDYSATGSYDSISIRDSISTNGPATGIQLNYLGTSLYNTVTITAPTGQNLIDTVDLSDNFAVDQSVLDQSEIMVRLYYSDDNRKTFAPRERRVYANMVVDVSDISIEVLASAPEDSSLVCMP